MRVALLVLLASVLGAPATAQEAAAAAARARQAAAAVGSVAWFEHGFEVVEAELSCDVAAAVRTAAALVAAARSSGVPDAPAVAGAMQQLAVAILDGPARAGPPGDEGLAHGPTDPTDGMVAAFAARLHTARARLVWLADEPNEFLTNVFAGLGAARASGDAVLRVRAAWALHRAVEYDAPANDAELLREIEALRDAPGVEIFTPWYRLNVYWRSSAEHSRDERLAALTGILAAADAIGDLRTRVHAEWDRAGIEATVNVAAAQQAFDAARAASERLGDRRLLAVAYEQLAQFALFRDRIDDAAEWLQKATDVTATRGMPDREVEQAHLRLQIASRQEDEAASAATTKLLDGLRRAEAQRYRGHATLRAQLLSAERHRLELADGLVRERERAAASALTMRNVVMLGAIVALASIAALALVGRRRLQRQIERTETEASTRRSLEQRMQRLERADSLGVFASGIAHDFNNLMVGVVGNAELLLREEVDPERRRLLGALAVAGERGARLCRQLQAHANERPTPRAEFDVAEVVRGLLPVLEASTRDRSSITLDVATGPFCISGSATEVEQVLLNLVANARDAGARRIGIRVERVAIDDADWPAAHVFGEPRAGEFVRIDVQDDGEGMRAEQIDRIFDPFFTTRFPGRGLGLAGVQAVMRQHRGIVVVESEPGRGSRFRVHLPGLPVAAVAAAVDPQPAEPIGAGVGTGVVPAMTVLVVDDEPHVRAYIEVALLQRGHRVVVAGDGTDLAPLVQELGDGRHCAALVDLTMPGADGRDVVQFLRQRTPNLAVVLMSGHDAEHLEATAHQFGADGSIVKPFSGNGLERTLAAAVARRRAASVSNES